MSATSRLSLTRIPRFVVLALLGPLLLAACSNDDAEPAATAPAQPRATERGQGDNDQAAVGRPLDTASRQPSTAIETAQEWVDAFVEGRCADAIDLTEFVVGTASGFRESCEEFADELDERIAHGLRVPIEYHSTAEFFPLLRHTYDLALAEIEEVYCTDEWTAICGYDELWYVTAAESVEECWPPEGTERSESDDSGYGEFVFPCRSLLGDAFVVLINDGWRVLNLDPHDDEDEDEDVDDDVHIIMEDG